MHEFFELTTKPKAGALWNQDLDPICAANRNWCKRHIVALWVGLSASITCYMLGSSLISSGMNWWQAVATILLGNLIVLFPMILIGHAGTKYGIPFPVFLRASFGIHGARVASLLRAIVACGWFGIQSWIGSDAIYQLLIIAIPKAAHGLYLGDFFGINVVQFFCFCSFCILQMYIMHHGMNAIKKLVSFAAPFLILMGVALVVWAWVKVGSFHAILAASYKLRENTTNSIWPIFWPGLTGVVGYWATLALNIPDFTRFARSQKDQMFGQLIGLPSAMTIYAFIGIIVTSAAIVIFNKVMWNPVILLSTFHNPFILVISMFSLILATTCCNLTANVVSPANDFSNLLPGKISFRMGTYITGVLGVLIFPWKLIADPNSYIFHWLIAYSALLGAVGGIMLCDYYVLRKTKINLRDLFHEQGEYTYSKGWNLSACYAFVLAIIPSIPGFLVKVNLLDAKFFSDWIVRLYDYAWFISLGLAFVFYWLLMRKKINKKPIFK